MKRRSFLAGGGLVAATYGLYDYFTIDKQDLPTHDDKPVSKLQFPFDMTKTYLILVVQDGNRDDDGDLNIRKLE